MLDFSGVNIGFAMTGSFCTFSKAFAQAQALSDLGASLVPIMSENASSISSRFGSADENVSASRKYLPQKSYLLYL